MKMKFRAFTIAEIVIAMVVLSSIAMILMPVLIKDTNKKTIETALEKTYSLFQQTARSAGLLSARGKISLGDTAAYTIFDTLKATKKSKKLATANEKLAEYYNGYTNDIGGGFLPSPVNTIVLGNGVFVMYFENGDVGTYLVTDVNGKRPPNKTGKDIFFFSAEYKDGYNILVYPSVKPNNYAECSFGDNDYRNRIGCAREMLNKK